MYFKRIIIALVLTVAVISCKKDEETSITPSLDGYLMIEGLPEFVAPNETDSPTPLTEYHLEAKGVSHPDGGEIGYYWKVIPSAPSPCTTKIFTYKPTDTLQTVTIYCYAYADGYSSSYAISHATVVKGGLDGSIKTPGFPSENILPGENYYTTIGAQTWTANNLSEGDAGIGFRNSEFMSDVYGKYYNYDDAMSACQALGTEWQLPSKEDWKTLITYIKGSMGANTTVASALMGNSTFNGTGMWEYWPTVGDITNASGFSAIPAGYANISSGYFSGAYEYATFWTATPVEGNNDEAFYTYLICDQPDLFFGKGDKNSFGASVRCIRK